MWRKTRKKHSRHRRNSACGSIGWRSPAAGLGLAAVVLLIGWAAVSYRQEIATLWPQSSSLYSALGMKVNARGIAFADVTRRYETEDDQMVLAVTGNIVNVSTRELPVPVGARDR